MVKSAQYKAVEPLRPCVDRAQALTDLSLRLEVSEATVVTILSLFYDEYHPYLEVTGDCINRQDWAALQSYIHKLKGSSGSLQMHLLRAQLVDLEWRLKRGEQITIEQLQPFYQEMRRVIDQYELAPSTASF